tara:strand:+ start:6941 stop:7210 length:270 start_codon:yes stop_codon:yes gene_type:complete
MELTAIINTTNITKNTRQKMLYIKRYINIIDEDTGRNIYNIVRKSSGEGPIRDTQSTQGVYINIADLEDEVIDAIYNLVQKRVDLIVLK